MKSKNHTRSLLAAITVAGLILSSTASHAETIYTWTGAVDGDWENTANWDANGVPVASFSTSADRLVINAINFSPTANGPSLYATKDIFNTESSLAGNTRISPGTSMTVGYATSQEFISLITHLRPPQTTKHDQQ